ncbi:MAG: hypothetical protein KF739_03230 [Cryobacterium sp.]|nr:hypothetical protein [Micrococcales bacterium]MBX3078129.1 hypothetical protein [Cryobacterium sp.]MBX3309431.1 hypothetical protein [Cryobacterium sp.]MCB1280193.1 hypothetical protein [Salinibacterium sp.]HNP15502.1 hypothetical protein [Terrimesophilobacter sp.]
MRASELAINLPVLDRDTSVVSAAQIIARDSRASIVVANAEGVPAAAISAVDVLRVLVPRYVMDDVSLAAVFDEKGADEVWRDVPSRTIGELVDDDESRVLDILDVDPDDTLLAVAARMADARAVIALVKGEPDQPARFVTLPAVLDAVLHVGLGASGRDSNA